MQQQYLIWKRNKEIFRPFMGFVLLVWLGLCLVTSTKYLLAYVNFLDVRNWTWSDKSLYIFATLFAVDTFFAISGFLMTYLFLKQMSKQKKFNVPMYYLHRFFRLTPAIIALLIFTIVFAPKIGSGPLWYMVDNVETDCRNKWWSIVTYLGNYIENGSTCLAHLWYLDVDMQLFWISPLILYPLYKKPKIGLTILASLLLVSIVTPALIISINKYHTASNTIDMDTEVQYESWLNVYQMTYNRAGPWLIGVYFGYEVAGNKRKPKNFTVYTGWLLAFGAFIFCIYGTKYFKEPTYEYNAVLEGLFTALSRPIWGFAVCWIIYTSIHDCAGPITSFLSSKIFLPLSRLSYCIYLVHMVVLRMQFAAFRTPKFFSDYYEWYYFLGDFTISIVVAILFSLLFESPILNLEKMIFNRKKQALTESQKDLKFSNIIEESKGSQGIEENNKV